MHWLYNVAEKAVSSLLLTAVTELRNESCVCDTDGEQFYRC